jgi:hypothetical protein
LTVGLQDVTGLIDAHDQNGRAIAMAGSGLPVHGLANRADTVKTRGW